MNGRRAPRKRIDLVQMRQHAADTLGWKELDRREASDMVAINNRSWGRFENPKDDRTVPDTLVKMFWYEVGLIRLEQLEEKGATGDIEKLLGGPLSVGRVSDFLSKLWEEWDPRGGGEGDD